MGELGSVLWTYQMVLQHPQITSVTILLDSTYAMRVMTEFINSWKRNGWVKSDGNTPGNLEMVKAGMAWAYTKYQTDPEFPRAELSARAARVGMFTGGDAQAPWDFRHSAQPFVAVADATGCYTGSPGRL